MTRVMTDRAAPADAGASAQARAAELHATCLHEYAHLAAARHFGACGFVTVRRAPRVQRDGWAWQGRFQLFGALADDEWRIVAIAGSVAECVSRGIADDAEALAAALREPGALSACDEVLARGFDANDVAYCVALIRNAWNAIDCDARERAAQISLECASPFVR